MDETPKKKRPPRQGVGQSKVVPARKLPVYATHQAPTVPTKKHPPLRAVQRAERRALEAAVTGKPEVDRQALRRLAYLRYVTEPQWGIDTLREQEPFKAIPPGTWHDWAHQDEWVIGRQLHFGRIQQIIMDKLADSQVQEHLATLQTTREFKAKLKERLARETFLEEPGSKLISAYCKLVETEVRLLELTAMVFAPRPLEKDVTPTVMVPTRRLTDEEARIAALAILTARREGDQHGGGSPETPEAGDAKAPKAQG